MVAKAIKEIIQVPECLPYKERAPGFCGATSGGAFGIAVPDQPLADYSSLFIITSTLSTFIQFGRTYSSILFCFSGIAKMDWFLSMGNAGAPL